MDTSSTNSMTVCRASAATSGACCVWQKKAAMLAQKHSVNATALEKALSAAKE